MRYILICETPFPSKLPPGRRLHAKAMTRDGIITDIKKFWTGAEETIALVDGCSDQVGADKKHYGVPVYRIFKQPCVRIPFLIHIDGKMDFEERRYSRPCPVCGIEGRGCDHRIPFEWVDPDHQCSPDCMLRPYQRVSQTHFQRR